MCPTSPFGSVPLHLVLLEKFRLPHLRKMLNNLDKKATSALKFNSLWTIPIARPSLRGTSRASSLVTPVPATRPMKDGNCISLRLLAFVTLVPPGEVHISTLQALPVSRSSLQTSRAGTSLPSGRRTSHAITTSTATTHSKPSSHAIVSVKTTIASHRKRTLLAFISLYVLMRRQNANYYKSYRAFIAGIPPGVVHVATPAAVPVSWSPVLGTSLGSPPDELRPLLHLASASLA